MGGQEGGWGREERAVREEVKGKRSQRGKGDGRVGGTEARKVVECLEHSKGTSCNTVSERLHNYTIIQHTSWNLLTSFELT